MRKPIVLICALLAVALPAALTGPAAWADVGVPGVAAADTSADAFVTRSGRQLRLNGKPFRFTGLNIYNANSVDNCWYTLGEVNPDVGHAFHRSLERIGKGNEVIRAWFFQNLATTDGERDWSAFDNTLEVARQHGVKVVATLGNQWGQCEGWGQYPDGYKTESWYTSEYRGHAGSAPGTPATYRGWVAEVVARYKNDPTILAWQLMNEAEDKTAYDGQCSDTAPQALRGFAADMGSLVKQIDPNHLLSLGTIGTGQCGATDGDYKTLHSVPEIDLCEYHDYQSGAMPGDEWNGLATRLSQCNALGKPLFVGEVGIRTDAVGSQLARAGVLASKLSAQFAAGVVGVLAWAWRNGVNGGSSDAGYEIGPKDPALAVLGSY
jgi:mannan endo-1,4-beta-mannosidase